MHPIMFQIGRVTFYTHGIMVVLGIIVGSVLVYFLAKNRKLETQYFFDNIIYTVLFGIIGARITYFVLYHNQFTSFKQIFYLWDGGLVSYGGFILGAIVFVLLMKVQRQPVFRWLDLLTPGFFLGLGFGRIGCMLAGEYDGVIFSPNSHALFSRLGNVPTSFYEAMLCFLIFVLSLIALKFEEKLNEKFIFTFLVLIYAAGRFIIDFWREQSIIFLHLSLGQITSLLIFVLGLIYLLVNQIEERKKYEKV